MIYLKIITRTNQMTSTVIRSLINKSNFNAKMSCLCLGPKGSGKTHLLKALQNHNSINETTCSMPTNGTNWYTIKFPETSSAVSNTTKKSSSITGNISSDKDIKSKGPRENSIQILEIGGAMAPLWRRYFNDVMKIIYVVDTSNLCQISAAGVLLYSTLAETKLQKTKFLLVLTKMDYAYRQMRNEALLMLQMSKLQKEIRQSMTILEVSSVTKDGLDKVYEWLKMS